MMYQPQQSPSSTAPRERVVKPEQIEQYFVLTEANPAMEQLPLSPQPVPFQSLRQPKEQVEASLALESIQIIDSSDTSEQHSPDKLNISNSMDNGPFEISSGPRLHQSPIDFSDELVNIPHVNLPNFPDQIDEHIRLEWLDLPNQLLQDVAENITTSDSLHPFHSLQLSHPSQSYPELPESQLGFHRLDFLQSPQQRRLYQRPRELSFLESSTFDILAQIVSSALLFLLIFGMSATVEVSHLREQLKNKYAILTGVSTQFLIMPLLGYTSVMLLHLLQGENVQFTEPMAISLLIVTASPGGSYSNWWCSMFNADLALSVTMTAISTMISAVMLPANLLLYVNAAFGFGKGSGGTTNTNDDEGSGNSEKGGEGGGKSSVLSNIDWPSLFISLAIVIFAIVLGLLSSFKISSHRFNRFANRMGSLSGVLLIVFSAVLSSLSGAHEAQLWGQPWSFYVGVTFPCLLGLCLATVFGLLTRLKKPEVVCVGVECCYQNVGIATSAAVAMFDDPFLRGQALCVPLFYGLMEAIVLGIYCIIAWKLDWTKAPKTENFCVMIMTNYEVEDDGVEREFESEEKGEDVIQMQMEEQDVRNVLNGRAATLAGHECHEESQMTQMTQISPISSTSTINLGSEDSWRSNGQHSSNVSNVQQPLTPHPNHSTRGRRWTWNAFFNEPDIHPPDEETNDRTPMSPKPPRTPPPPVSPKRISSLSRTVNAVSDVLESISEDGFGSPGSLVSFHKEEKGEYSRCRLSSEDSASWGTVGTMTTLSTTDATSVTSMSLNDKPLVNSLMKGSF